MCRNHGFLSALHSREMVSIGWGHREGLVARDRHGTLLDERDNFRFTRSLLTPSSAAFRTCLKLLADTVQNARLHKPFHGIVPCRTVAYERRKSTVIQRCSPDSPSSFITLSSAKHNRLARKVNRYIKMLFFIIFILSLCE